MDCPFCSATMRYRTDLMINGWWCDDCHDGMEGPPPQANDNEPAAIREPD